MSCLFAEMRRAALLAEWGRQIGGALKHRVGEKFGCSRESLNRFNERIYL